MYIYDNYIVRDVWPPFPSPGRGGPDGGHGDAAEGEGGLRAKFPGAEGHHRPGAQGRSMAQPPC